MVCPRVFTFLLAELRIMREYRFKCMARMSFQKWQPSAALCHSVKLDCTVPQHIRRQLAMVSPMSSRYKRHWTRDRPAVALLDPLCRAHHARNDRCRRHDPVLGDSRLHRGEKFYAVVKAAVSNGRSAHRQQHTEKGLAGRCKQLRPADCQAFPARADASLAPRVPG